MSNLAKHFDRDPETNEVLWFPAPPVDMPRKAAPRYSLAYLHFRAKKRKQELEGDMKHGMDVEGADSSTAMKRGRWENLPTVTETLRAVAKELAEKM